MKTQRHLFLLLLTLFFTACQYEFPELPQENPAPGEANFSKTVAVGNSITAGFMDGALYNRGQENSFIHILSQQFQLAGGGDFHQPAINSENGFFSMGPNGPLGRLILANDPLTGQTLPAPIGAGDLPSAYTGDKSALNNFAVPGITLGQALSPLTSGPASADNPAYNALYARFASNPGQSSVINDAATALADGGTFFSFWLGANDLLGYAIGGASEPSILTSDEDFQIRFGAALNTLLAANESANGMVFNIPPIVELPYFNLVPYNPLPLSQAEADQVNQGYAAYNGGLIQAQTLGFISEEERIYRTISFEAGLNAFVMEDENLTDLSALGMPSIRQSRPEDKAVLLLSEALRPSENSPQRGIEFPVEDEYVLTPEEQAEINAKANTFNSIITGQVNTNTERLLLIDIKSFFEKVQNGAINSEGAVLSASIIPPSGGFSVDGIHPNARAHAFISNLCAEAINQKWNASIPKVNPNAYIGNDLPR
ncbi:hypothetical protein KZP23_18950 [Echinicola marina]|uniref:hypothetical protein n=1 Tax=Echinicola marina TaxID=2859768 RepID=UPI001CF70CEE|nr:hypothetical protein [Echinicola marina]UCS92737.1 hypothetical protein KZP23_18950 [Echinicola marina]